MPTPIRPRSLRRFAAVALVAASIIGAAACGAKEPSQDELSAALVDSGLSKDVADCAAGAVIDTLSPSQIENIMERGGGGAPIDDPEQTNDEMDQLRTAMDECRTLQAAQTTTTIATTTTVAPGDTTETTVPVGTDGAELNPTEG